MRSFINGGGVYLNVDMSDVQRTIDLMRGVLTREQFERLMYRTFGEAGRRSKTLIAREVVQDYVVTQAWVRSQIQRYRLSFGGPSPVTCVIPISGHKGSIGGRFRARGGRRGARIRASIVTAGQSTLPETMDHQGGNPPFMVNGVAFTRRTHRRFPIVRVVGLGVPQMPLNRSSDEVQDSLLQYIGNRLEHNFSFMFGKGG